MLAGLMGIKACELMTAHAFAILQLCVHYFFFLCANLSAFKKLTRCPL